MNKHATRLQRWIAGGFGALFLAVSLPAGAFAQAQPQAGDGVDRLTVHLSDPTRPGSVKVSLFNGGITVKTYDGKDINIEGRLREEPPMRMEEQRPGMHRFSVGTTGLTADEDNNDVNITTESMFRTIDLTLTVPKHTSLSLRTVNSGGITVDGVDGDLDVSVINGPINLNDISGGVVAHTINGNLRATFARLDQSKPTAFSSMNGDIDITLPADAKANFHLNSQRGGVFSDFDLQLQYAPGVVEHSGNGGHQIRMGGGAHATINGGGVDVQISNFNGSIYIHKAGNAR